MKNAIFNAIYDLPIRSGTKVMNFQVCEIGLWNYSVVSERRNSRKIRLAIKSDSAWKMLYLMLYMTSKLVRVQKLWDFKNRFCLFSSRPTAIELLPLSLFFYFQILFRLLVAYHNFSYNNVHWKLLLFLCLLLNSEFYLYENYFILLIIASYCTWSK